LEWKEDAGRIDPEWVYGTCEEATEVNETGCYGRATIVPLYRSPALADEERSAIVWCVDMAATIATECDEELAALRGLLERTK
jgi:hypothetical protein